MYTSYIYSTHCQQGNYLKMFSLYHIMQIVAYKHELPITKSSNCRYIIFRVQSFISGKKDFFPLTSQSPRLWRDGIILQVCSETICDLLEEGRQEAAPRIKPKRGLSPCEVQQTHVAATHTSSMSLITLSTFKLYFRLDCGWLILLIDEKM